MKRGKQQCRAIAASLGICGICRALPAAMLYFDNASSDAAGDTICFRTGARAVDRDGVLSPNEKAAPCGAAFVEDAEDPSVRQD